MMHNGKETSVEKEPRESLNSDYANKDLAHAAEAEKKEEEIESPRSSTSHDELPIVQRTSGSGLTRTKSAASQAITKVVSRLSTYSTKEPGPPPDGGLLAWTQAACGWLCIFNTWGFVNSFGAFQTHYTTTLPQSPSTISWIGSTQAFFTFFLAMFSGRALDAGLFRPTIIIGIVFQLIGLFTMAQSTKYWHLLLTHGVLTGIGGGIFFCPVMGLISTYFDNNRGIAMGFATSGNAVGGIVYSLVVRQLLPVLGFAWTVRILGFINLATLGVTVAFMKPRLTPRKSAPLVDWISLNDTPYLLFIVACCFLMASVYFCFYYIASYARDTLGLTYTSSVTLVILLNGVGIPARLLPGLIADRWTGPLNIFFLITFCNIILIFSWLAVDSLTGFYIWTIFFGMSAAAWQSLFPTAVGSLGVDLNKSGIRLGMAFSTISFAALVGGPIGGAILQAGGGNYTGSIVWSGITTSIGVCFVLAARVVKHGWEWKLKC
ncbi:MFS general substrate transporter [Venturia nashicola]|nr:MFS general substrate transporter [Venturia nashicola]